ncbi:MAG: hypothetical protein IKQ95_01240 [Synergistaceae bacterium]|nr:hypothetical protein [Synergistaceae bacterium]
MQRVRNNFHTARKHTQKIRKDVRKLRAQWRRDYYEKDPSPATLRAMEEAKQIAENWLNYHEKNDND